MGCAFQRFLVLALGLSAAVALAQTGDGVEIPIERCDVLPVVRVRIDGQEKRLLVDTGATSILNLSSFAGGRSTRIRVSSWRGTAATSAREISIPDLELGNHRLRNLKLPAIDLSPIGKACNGQIDGILGVDLLDRLGVTIDLKRRVARLGDAPAESPLMDDMLQAMRHCLTAFNQGKAEELEECLDPDIVLYTPWGEFRGRKGVMQYLKNRYLKHVPNLEYSETLRDTRRFGDALWYSYDYKLQTPSDRIVGHGMAMCRRENGVWRLLNIHNSLVQPEPEPK